MNLLTYNDLIGLIEKMTPEQRAQPVLREDENTGQFSGFTGINFWDHEDWVLMPDQHPFLEEDCCTVYYDEGKLIRSGVDPDWQEILKRNGG
jgi:hypothetical protein